MTVICFRFVYHDEFYDFHENKPKTVIQAQKWKRLKLHHENLFEMSTEVYLDMNRHPYTQINSTFLIHLQMNQNI